MRGHALIWFNHTRPSFTRTANESAAPLKDKPTLLNDMKTHTDGTIERLNAAKFTNTIYAWDVVNEAIWDEYDGGTRVGTTPYRKCDLYDIAGVDYIIQSFKYADAKLASMGIRNKVKLFYNDFNLNNQPKRDRTLTMIDTLIAAGTPIDGIGMQAHYAVPYFNTAAFKASAEAFLAKGLDVQITELDISIYGPGTDSQVSAADYNNDYGNLKTKQLNIYREIFRIVRDPRYQTGAGGWGKVTGLTLWGIADDYTWIDKPGRKDYPMLFGLDGVCKINLSEILTYRAATYYL